MAGNQGFYGHDFFQAMARRLEAARGSNVRFLENEVSNPRGYPQGTRYAETALEAAMSEFGLQVRDEDLDDGHGVGFRPDLVVDVR